MTENEKHDILLAGQIPAFDVMDSCLNRFLPLDINGIEFELVAIQDERENISDKDYYARIIILASLALKKMKEEEE